MPSSYFTFLSTPSEVVKVSFRPCKITGEGMRYGFEDSARRSTSLNRLTLAKMKRFL